MQKIISELSYLSFLKYFESLFLLSDLTVCVGERPTLGPTCFLLLMRFFANRMLCNSVGGDVTEKFSALNLCKLQ